MLFDMLFGIFITVIHMALVGGPTRSPQVVPESLAVTGSPTVIVPPHLLTVACISGFHSIVVKNCESNNHIIGEFL